MATPRELASAIMVKAEEAMNLIKRPFYGQGWEPEHREVMFMAISQKAKELAEVERIEVSRRARMRAKRG